MSADPLSITTAILTLLHTAQKVVTLLDVFVHAEQKVAELQQDCILTQHVLEYLHEQLQSRDPRTLETLELNGIGKKNTRAAAGISLRDALYNSVKQLQLDLRVLEKELKTLGRPHRPETRIGTLIVKGQVAWKMAYLEAMHQKILSKRMELQLVANDLRSQVQNTSAGTANAFADSGRQSDDSLLMRTFFERFLNHSRHVALSAPLPSLDTRQRIIKAVENDKPRELNDLLQGVTPNFHIKLEDGELSPLQVAAKRGDLATVNVLISHNARINCCGGGEETPLNLAISHNHPEVALALIRRGANILLAGRGEQTPLHLAARQNLFAVVQVLVNNGAELNAYNEAGRTPLMESVLRGDRDTMPEDTRVLQLLLQPNRDATPADPCLGSLGDRKTPMHVAAAEGYLSELAVMLQISAHAGKHLLLDAEDRTPLWHAAKHGHVDAVKLLLSAGAKTHVNQLARDPTLPTALWAMAASERPPKTDGVSALLAAGADPNTPNSAGQTLLHHATLTHNLPLLTLLLAHAADPTLPDASGLLPLHHAAQTGHKPILLALLPLSDPNTSDSAGITPLMHAAEHGHDHLLPLLLARGEGDGDAAASLSHRDRAGCTAFYLACARGRLLCAAYLLGRGARIDEASYKGNTPLHVAARMGQVETVAWLVRMGADVGVRSRGAFGGLAEGVVGTPAEVVRGAGLGGEVEGRVLALLREGGERQMGE